MVNMTILQGRLTRDPELKQTAGGIDVCRFTVAWSEKYKETEKNLFLDCTAFAGTAKMVANYFKKGKEIVVEGQLQTDKWEKDGEKHSKTSCLVNRVHFCGPKDGSAPAASSDSAPAASDDFMKIPEGEDEDLPFA